MRNGQAEHAYPTVPAARWLGAPSFPKSIPACHSATQRLPRTFLLAMCAISETSAQTAPQVSYVYPAGAQRGQTVEVDLGGFDFTPDMDFFVHAERFELTPLGPPGRFFVPEPPYWFGPKGRSGAFPIPREVQARIEIPEDMPLGPVFWQVANANGGSTTGVFIVSDTPEVLESRRRDQPQPLASLPVTVNGRLRKITEVDRYVVTPEDDGPIAVKLMARQLGSNFNAALAVLDDAGAVVRDVADTEGVDLETSFWGEAGRRYTIQLHDIDFRGNRTFGLSPFGPPWPCRARCDPSRRKARNAARHPFPCTGC